MERLLQPQPMSNMYAYIYIYAYTYIYIYIYIYMHIHMRRGPAEHERGTRFSSAMWRQVQQRTSKRPFLRSCARYLSSRRTEQLQRLKRRALNKRVPHASACQRPRFWRELRGSQGRRSEHRSTWGYERVMNWNCNTIKPGVTYNPHSLGPP